MSAKHTSGPWQTKHGHDLEGQITIIGNVDGEYHDGVPHCTYDVIAVCQDYFGESVPNAVANARLIAAAPDLLEALKNLSAVCEGVWSVISDAETNVLREAWSKADAAISKATGAANV